MGFSFPFKEWFAESEFIKDQFMEAGNRGRQNHEQFLNGQLHWSQLLSLLHVNNRVLA